MKRALFVIAAGLIAAAFANPLVENLSNAGVFGAGYADHDQSSIGPTLAIASVFAIGFIALRTLSHWIAAFARDFSGRPRRADIPFVLGVQVIAEYAMESTERFVHGGTMSGVTWIGGPIAFALLVHITMGIVVTIGLRHAFCALARTIAQTARAVFEAFVFLRSRQTTSVYCGRCDRRCVVRSPFARTGPRRGRAPPHAPTLA